ncbi:MAG: FAD-binding protein, partial [Spirochaetota bacterium]|nr:FAD-binding protein [Spirochaetota bacterium]
RPRTGPHPLPDGDFSSQPQEQAVREGVDFRSEWYDVLDLLYDPQEGRAYGVTAMDLRNSRIHLIKAAAVLFATGG